MLHVFFGFLIVAGVFGSVIRPPAPKVSSLVDARFKVALERGTDSDWSEFCEAALEADRLTPAQQKFIGECERETNFGGIE